MEEGTAVSDVVDSGVVVDVVEIVVGVLVGVIGEGTVVTEGDDPGVAVDVVETVGGVEGEVGSESVVTEVVVS